LATDKGKFIVWDIEKDQEVISSDVHSKEIFSFTVTYDHTMLITCSRDGTAKLLNHQTLESVRDF